ncbi:MAG: UvrD-helicase domain-containing protein [Candidatus Sumerlaeia bacterium]|nr:UvrD-helicase domain-containing protein [Candidatus Sumerlaeia bacterium]
MKWTARQRDGIESRARELLVSAGAGAGKTSVLIARVLAQLLDPADPHSLDDYLVVTFTRAAAENMRAKLEERLRERAAGEADKDTRERLERQLAILPRARISTIHSFCLDLVVANATALGLPPTVEVLSEQEAALVRREVLEEHLEEHVADGDARTLLADMIRARSSLGRADTLLADIDGVLAELENMPDPHAFAEAACAEWTEAADAGGEWARTRLGAALVRALDAALAELRALANAFASQRFAAAGASTRAQFLDDLDRARAYLATAPAVGGSPGSPPPLGLTTPRGKPENDPLIALHRAHIEAWKDAAATVSAMVALDPIGYFAQRAQVVRVLLHDFGAELLGRLEARHIADRKLPFSMLERLALRLLRGVDGAPTELANGLAAGWREILTDEYQDTNPVQHALFEALRRARGSRFFAVGDVKQSIYRFRGAAPELFLGELRAAEPIQAGAPRAKLALVENFRSAPELLEAFNALFERLFDADPQEIVFDADHRFSPGRPAACAPGPRLMLDIVAAAQGEDSDPESEAPSMEDEAELLARRVAECGPAWGRIAVLLRSTSKSLGACTRAFDRRGIPWTATSRDGFLSAPEIVEALAVLRAVGSPYDEAALLGALCGAAAEWTPEELLRLRHTPGGRAYIDRLEAAAEGADLAPRAAAFLARHERWQRESLREPVADLLARLYDELHLLERARVRRQGERRVANLLYLLELARQFDTFQRRGLARFLAFLRELESRGGDFGMPPPPAEGSDAVRILTIHQSKGLEFPVVFLPFAHRKFNRVDESGPVLLDPAGRVAVRGFWRGASEELDPIREELRARERRLANSEELRLLYVALTRAEEQAHISATLAKQRDRWPVELDPEKPANCFVDWLLPVFTALTGAEPGADTPVSARAGTVELRVLAPEHFPEPAPAQGAEPDSYDADAFRAALARLRSGGAAEREPKFRAKVSVTEAKRLHEQSAAAERGGPPVRREATQPNPFAARESAPGDDTAMRRGTATHRFLALLDVEALNSGASLRGELARCVEQGLLADADAKLVPLERIGSFLNGPLGERLRLAAGTLRREVSFTCAILPGELHPDLERDVRGPVILQGTVDALFRRPDGGLVLLDYKTDHCGPGDARLPALVGRYTPQLQLYRLGLERALREPVAELHLHFLSADRTETLPGRPPTAEEWREWLAPAVVAEPDPEAPPERHVAL